MGCGGMVAATSTLSSILSSLSPILSTLSILSVLSVLSIWILSYLSLYSVLDLSSVLFSILLSILYYVFFTELFLVSAIFVVLIISATKSLHSDFIDSHSFPLSIGLGMEGIRLILIPILSALSLISTILSFGGMGIDVLFKLPF